MSVTKVTVDTGAVRDLLHSAGVRSLLMDECEQAADRCNALVQWHSPMQADAYGAGVQDGGFTAVGIVGMRNLGPYKDGQHAVHYYEAKHKVLLRGTGW